MPKTKLLIVAMFLMILCLSSCDQEPKPLVVTYQLTHSVDTTFNNRYRRQIDRQVDSICKYNYQTMYDQAVDSLLRIEIARMEELLD